MAGKDGFRIDVEGFAKEYLTQVMGSEAGGRAAARVAMAFRTLSQRNPKVSQCTSASVGLCVAMCAMTGLSPGGAFPDCDVIPRENSVQRDSGKWEKELQLNWQIGFRGIIRLARRAGAAIKVKVIYKGQATAERGEERRAVESVHALDGLRDAGYTIVIGDPPPMAKRTMENVIGVEVSVRMGEWTDRIVMDREMIEKRRAKSEGWRRANADLTAKESWKRDKAQSAPWIEWEEEMISKTGIRYAASRGIVPLDDVLDHAIKVDIDAETTVIDVEPDRAPRAAPLPETHQIAEAPSIDDFDAQAELDKRAQREPVPREEAKTEAAHEGDLSPEDRLRAEIEELEEAEGVMPDERGRFRGDHGLAVPFSAANIMQLRAYKARIVGGAK